MGLIHVPTLTHCNANARNGMSPSAWLHRRLVDSENHITAYRKRTVWSRGYELGQSTGGTTATTTIARFRFRTGYGVSQVPVMLVMGLTTASGGAGSTANPYAEVTLTISGGATTTLGPYAYGVSPSATPTDAPDEVNEIVKFAPVSGNTVYECAVITYDHARVLAGLAWELGTSTVVETTNYMNTHSPAAGSPIYDADRERLFVGLSNMHTRNGGICEHWSLLDGTARTRTSATAINLIDNSSTGSPVAGTNPGFYLDCRYHNRRRSTTVPFELGVYGSVAGGAGGTARVIDAAGNTYCATAVTGAAGWYTATGNLPTAETYYTLQFLGDGVNALSVYGTSLIETG
jgi:hypothetical protein